MSVERESNLRQQIAEAEKRIAESEATERHAQAKLDRALREGHDSTLARRLLEEAGRLHGDAILLRDRAQSELNQHFADIDAARGQALLDAAQAELDALLLRFAVDHLCQPEELSHAA